MVFIVPTASGFDTVKSRVIAGTDAVWVNAGILSEPEAARLRDSGWNLTRWSNPLNVDDLGGALDTVRLHHPGQAIWLELLDG